MKARIGVDCFSGSHDLDQTGNGYAHLPIDAIMKYLSLVIITANHLSNLLDHHMDVSALRDQPRPDV